MKQIEISMYVEDAVADLEHEKARGYVDRPEIVTGKVSLIDATSEWKDNDLYVAVGKLRTLLDHPHPITVADALKLLPPQSMVGIECTNIRFKTALAAVTWVKSMEPYESYYNYLTLKSLRFDSADRCQLVAEFNREFYKDMISSIQEILNRSNIRILDFCRTIPESTDLGIAVYSDLEKDPVYTTAHPTDLSDYPFPTDGAYRISQCRMRNFKIDEFNRITFDAIPANLIEKPKAVNDDMNDDMINTEIKSYTPEKGDDADPAKMETQGKDPDRMSHEYYDETVNKITEQIACKVVTLEHVLDQIAEHDRVYVHFVNISNHDISGYIREIKQLQRYDTFLKHSQIMTICHDGDTTWFRPTFALEAILPSSMMMDLHQIKSSKNNDGCMLNGCFQRRRLGQ